MDIVDVTSLAFGILGLAFAIATHVRTRRKERVVRFQLAKMIVVVRTLEAYAGWAVDHFRNVRKSIDSEWSDEVRRKASEAVHTGSADAMAANRYAHELLRDLGHCSFLHLEKLKISRLAAR